jgi:pSer/pThr/pTyr-binding forkhead associated (FHA) protein
MDAPQIFNTAIFLVTSAGPDQGRRFALDQDEITIGRALASDIRFENGRVSRYHAIVRRRATTLYLEDTLSTGGTYLNRELLTTPRELHPGDVITLASCIELRFEGMQAAAVRFAS